MALHRVRTLELAYSLEQTESALHNIVLNTCTELDSIVGVQYRTDIVRAGGLKAILRVMKEYHDAVDIQDLSCQALSNLAFENDKTRLVIAQLGGISAILTAMTTHLNDEDLQYHALQTLWRLTFNDWVRDKIVKMGTVDAIRQAMATHPSSKEYVQFWGELTLKNLEDPQDEIFDGLDLPTWLIDLAIIIILLVFFRSLY